MQSSVYIPAFVSTNPSPQELTYAKGRTKWCSHEFIDSTMLKKAL